MEISTTVLMFKETNFITTQKGVPIDGKNDP